MQRQFISSIKMRSQVRTRLLTCLCRFGDTVLHLATYKNNVQMCELLLELGANVNEMNEL